MADPIVVELTEGQKLAVLKRFGSTYQSELNELEAKLRDMQTANAEAEFLAQYIKEQPEVTALRVDAAEIQRLEQRREYLLQLIKVIGHYTPEQKDVKIQAPGGRVSRY